MAIESLIGLGIFVAGMAAFALYAGRHREKDHPRKPHK